MWGFFVWDWIYRSRDSSAGRMRSAGLHDNRPLQRCVACADTTPHITVRFIAVRSSNNVKLSFLSFLYRTTKKRYRQMRHCKWSNLSKFLRNYRFERKWTRLGSNARWRLQRWLPRSHIWVITIRKTASWRASKRSERCTGLLWLELV